MTISLPIKAFLGGLAIIVSLASAAQAGRPLIQSEDACRDVAKYYDLSWGGAKSKYETKGCYYYANGGYAKTVWYGKGGWLGNQNANTGDGKEANGKRRFDKLCLHTRDMFSRLHGKEVCSGGQSCPTLRSKKANLYNSLVKPHKIKCDCGNDEDGNANNKGKGCAKW